jgi:predicted amidohydrolase
VKLGVVLAQLPPTTSVAQNVESISAAVAAAEPGDVVVTPEGSVSGYFEDLRFLETLSSEEVESALDTLGALAEAAGVDLWVGACLRDGRAWRNAAYGLTADGLRLRYQKANLGTTERGVFEPGDSLPTFALRRDGAEAVVGVQICRDLRFPEQWRALSESGAAAILHLTSALSDSPPTIWRSMLVSRAVENQRFVVSANAAGRQSSPTLAVAPTGDVIAECERGDVEVIRVELDLAEAEDTYLRQRRLDLVPSDAAEFRSAQTSN